MKLKRFGFFNELRHGDINGISLKDVISENADMDEEKQINYLKNGVCLIGCPGMVEDVLNENSGIIGAPHILTDGVWEWPADLTYYVKKYHVRLPDDFVRHMKSNCWIPPSEGKIKFDELEL